MSNSGTYHLYKMTKSTPCFKKGQKVWVSCSQRYAIAYGRLKGDGKWISAFIRPTQYILITPLGRKIELVSDINNHGKPNAKYICNVNLSGYLHDLFTLMERNHFQMNVKMTEKPHILTLKSIGYKASTSDILAIHQKMRDDFSKTVKMSIHFALKDQKKAMIAEIKERFNIDLTDPCDNMSIAEMRKLDWLRR